MEYMLKKEARLSASLKIHRKQEATKILNKKGPLKKYAFTF